ncbi:MAG: helix-turn-helix domain-containing protein [Planctomycetota bacterium]
MATSALADDLQALGFSALEAQVYLALLQTPDATGYRIAKAVGKPVANVYKALDALSAKGAVLVEDSDPRAFTPVPPKDLLRAQERAFRERTRRLERGLRALAPAATPQKIYSIGSSEGVFEQVRTLLAATEDVVLVDAFPMVLEQLRDDLAAAAVRGVTVHVKAYAPMAIDGVHVTCDEAATDVRGRWPCQWINAVADGRSVVLAALSATGDEVIQAVRSESAFLAWILHGGLLAEISWSALDDQRLGRSLKQRHEAARAQRDLAIDRSWSEHRGLRQLLEQQGRVSLAAATGGGTR